MKHNVNMTVELLVNIYGVNFALSEDSVPQMPKTVTRGLGISGPQRALNWTFLSIRINIFSLTV